MGAGQGYSVTLCRESVPISAGGSSTRRSRGKSLASRRTLFWIPCGASNRRLSAVDKAGQSRIYFVSGRKSDWRQPPLDSACSGCTDSTLGDRCPPRLVADTQHQTLHPGRRSALFPTHCNSRGVFSRTLFAIPLGHRTATRQRRVARISRPAHETRGLRADAGKKITSSLKLKPLHNFYFNLLGRRVQLDDAKFSNLSGVDCFRLGFAGGCAALPARLQHRAERR